MLEKKKKNFKKFNTLLSTLLYLVLGFALELLSLLGKARTVSFSCAVLHPGWVPASLRLALLLTSAASVRHFSGRLTQPTPGHTAKTRQGTGYIPFPVCQQRPRHWAPLHKACQNVTQWDTSGQSDPWILFLGFLRKLLTNPSTLLLANSFTTHPAAAAGTPVSATDPVFTNSSSRPRKGRGGFQAEGTRGKNKKLVWWKLPVRRMAGARKRWMLDWKEIQTELQRALKMFSTGCVTWGRLDEPQCFLSLTYRP